MANKSATSPYGNQLATSRCDGIWETTRPNRLNDFCPRQLVTDLLAYGETGVIGFWPYVGPPTRTQVRCIMKRNRDRHVHASFNIAQHCKALCCRASSRTIAIPYRIARVGLYIAPFTIAGSPPVCNFFLHGTNYRPITSFYF